MMVNKIAGKTRADWNSCYLYYLFFWRIVVWTFDSCNIALYRFHWYYLVQAVCFVGISRLQLFLSEALHNYAPVVYNPVSLGLSLLSEIEVFIAFLTYSAFCHLRDKIEGFFSVADQFWKLCKWILIFIRIRSY